jgi:hypothetical protein
MNHPDEYKIINILSIEQNAALSSKELYSAHIIIDRGRLLKNHSHYSNTELIELTENLTNLDVINNPVSDKKYEFLLIKRR